MVVALRLRAALFGMALVLGGLAWAGLPFLLDRPKHSNPFDPAYEGPRVNTPAATAVPPFSATASPVQSPTHSPTMAFSATASLSPSFSPTLIDSATLTATRSQTPTPAPSFTSSSSATGSPTQTASPTRTLTGTLSPTATRTGTPTVSATITATGTPCALSYQAQWGSGGTGNGQFDGPSGIAVDSSGNVYVSEINSNRVQEFDSSGAYLAQWGSSGSGNGQFHNPYGLAVDSANGKVYVGDYANSRIQKFNLSGAYLAQWGSSGSGNGQFQNIGWPAVDSLGNVYGADVNNGRIEKFDSSGNYLDQFTGFNGPFGVAIDSSGNIYAANVNGNSIKVITPGGAPLHQWGSLGSGNGQLNQPFGVALDLSGNLYVADIGNNRIQEFDSSGNYVAQWGGLGSGNGQLNGPRGVAVDSQGNLYVADTGNNRIQKFGFCGVAPSPTQSPLVTVTMSPTLSPTPSSSPALSSTPSYTISSTATITLTPVATVVCGNPIAVGQTALGSPLALGGNVMLASPIVVSSAGTLASLNVYIDTPNGGLIEGALYSDYGGGYPSVLLAVSSGQAVTAGWNTILLPPTALTGPATYWMVIQFENIQYFSQQASAPGSLLMVSQAYGAFPGLFPASSSTAFQLSMYASICGVPTSTPTPVPLCAFPTPIGQLTPGTPTAYNNLILADAVIIYNDVNITALHLYIPSSGGGLLTGAVYTDSAGSSYLGNGSSYPGSLLVSSASQAAVTGWNSIPLPPTVLSASGPTVYYISVQMQNGQWLSQQNSSLPQTLAFAVQSYGAFPASFPAGSASSLALSFYADTCPLPSLTPTISPNVTATPSPSASATPNCSGNSALGSPTYYLGTASIGATAEPGLQTSVACNQYILAGPATIQRLVLYGFGSATNIVAGIYADNGGGHPGSLIVQSAVVPVVPSGWFSIPIPETVLPSGTYWLAFDIAGAFTAYGQSGTDMVMQSGTTFGSLPATFASNGVLPNFQASFYADLCPQAYTPTPSPTATCPPEALYQWGVQGSGDGQFNSPRGIAIGAAGSVYVTDQVNNRVQKFSPAGAYQAQWTGFSNPAGVAFDSSGNFFVLESGGGIIKKYNSAGTFQTQWGCVGSYGLTVGNSDAIFVADTASDLIKVFSNTGAFITQWGGSGTGDGQLNSPYGLAADATGNVYVADSGNNRIQKFNSNGNFLAQWGSFYSVLSSGPGGHGQFKQPQGIGVDSSGYVYVADSGNDRVQKFDANGTYLGEWGVRGSDCMQFSGPYGVAINASGAVYVTDNSNNRVQAFSNTILPTLVATFTTVPSPTPVPTATIIPNFVLQWGGSGSADGQFYSPNSVATDSSGNVYVADKDNGRIQKFSSSGIFISKWGTYGNGNGQFQTLAAVALDAAGNVYAGDAYLNRVQKFDSSGAYLTQWGGVGALRGLAVDASSNVYVADFGGSIKKFDSNGAFITQWPSPNAVGVAVDSSGKVYASDYYGNQVYATDSSGVAVTQWGSSGSADGQFQNPYGVAVDSSGDILVADSTNNRIERFSSSGSFLGKWGVGGSGPGQFNQPLGIAGDASGHVYVADSANNRIQKLTP